MRLKFLTAAPGRDFKPGETRDFNGPVEEGYARKYIDRGWAEEVIPPPPPAPVLKEVKDQKSSDK